MERAAAALFEPGRIPDPDSVHSLAELADSLDQGLVWVACQGGRVMGFVLASRHGEELHIDELDVHPAFSRRGIGAELLRHAQRRARELNLRRLTLTTFADVPWNGPYYQRLGFEALTDDGLSERLRSVLREEACMGLENRTAMAIATEPPP